MAYLHPSPDGTSGAQYKSTAFEAQLIAAKKRFNHSSPLCTIPNEILGRILLHTQATTQPRRGAIDAYDFYMDHLGPYSKWKNMMLVCSHIRKIAVSTPELWTHVDLAWPSDCISMVLSRAKTLPLTFSAWTVYRGRERSQEDVSLAAVCFRRAYAASIDFMDDFGMREIAQVTNQLAPSLISLYVGLQNDQEHSFTASLKHYPALVHLTLESGGLGERIEARMPCLTRFRVNNIQVGSDLRDSIGFLQYSPLLTEFIFDEGEPSEPNDDETLLPPLSFPQLRLLVLIGSPCIVRGILTAIKSPIPLLASLAVDMRDPEDPIADNILPDIIKRIMVHWRTASTALFPPAHVNRSQAFNSNSPEYQLVIRTSGPSSPALSLKLPFEYQYAPLYEEHGLVITNA
jgi:hypothetical protein